MEYARLAGFQPVPYVTPTHQWQTADDMFFRDRREAGRRLAALLAKYADRSDVIVLALPRGGVPVAYEVARALHAPLDVFVVRKLGLPGHEELAMGAVASGDVRVINRDVVDALGIPEELIERVADRLSGRERMGCICDSVRTDEGEQRTARSRDRAYGAETLGVVGESGLLHA